MKENIIVAQACCGGRRKRIRAMSSLLQVYRAKPNPTGKDRSAHGPKPEQMNGEWVDIKNVGSATIPFSSIEIHHTQFGRTCSEVLGTERYWKGSSSDTG